MTGVNIDFLLSGRSWKAREGERDALMLFVWVPLILTLVKLACTQSQHKDFPPSLQKKAFYLFMYRTKKKTS